MGMLGAEPLDSIYFEIYCTIFDAKPWSHWFSYNIVVLLSIRGSDVINTRLNYLMSVCHQ